MSVLRRDQQWNIAKAKGVLKETGRLGQHLSNELLLIIDDLSRQLEKYQNVEVKLEKKRSAPVEPNEEDSNLG